MIRKYKRFIIMLMAAFVAISMVTVDAKASVKKSGKVDNEIAWSYNSKTKTLTFRPFKSSENPKKIKKHTSDLEYWLENSKKQVYKKGVTRLLRCDALIGSYPHDEYGDAFSKLKRVSLPRSVKVIPPAAYERAHNLNNVSMSSVEYVGKDAFSGEVLKVDNNNQIVFPKRIKRIEYNAFNLWNKKYRNTSLKLNDGLEYIAEGVFSGCSLKEIYIPDSVKTIEADAFAYNKCLKKVVLPNKIERIETGLFSYCKNLENIMLPDSVVRIEAGVFAYSGLESIMIPPNVEILGGLYDNDIYLRDDLGVFYKCTNLKRIEFSGTKIKKVYPNTMTGIPKSTEIVVPTGMKEKYREMFVEAGLSTDAVIIEKDFGKKRPYYKLSRNEAAIKEGFTRRLDVLYLTGKEQISIESEDEAVAIVSGINSSGEALIKASGIGETVINVNVDGYELSCKVKVNSSDANNDEEELRKLIKRQRNYGATVSENIHNSSQYTWNNGRLIGIDWHCESVYGDIDLNPFTYLSSFGCYGGGMSEPWIYNYVWSIDANDCANLKYVDCTDGYIREFYAENAVNLEEVDLHWTSVRVIDVSSATKLQELVLPYDQKIKKLRINDNVDKENINKWHVDSRVESVEYIVEPR